MHAMRARPRAAVPAWLVLALCTLFWLGATQRSEAFLLNLGYQTLRLLENADPISHDITLRLNPETKEAYFTDKFTIAAQKNIGDFYVLLGHDYVLERAGTVDGEVLSHRVYIQWASLPFTIYRINFSERVAAGEETTVVLEYRLGPDTVKTVSPFVTDDLFIAIVTMFWYPQMPGESFFEATVHMEGPDDWVMIGEGEPLEGTNGRSWRTVAPVTGLNFVAGWFEPVEMSAESWRVVGWRAPGWGRYLEEMMEHTVGAMRFYESLLGPLGLERLDVVSLPIYLGGSLSQFSGWMFDEYMTSYGIRDTALRAYMAGHEVAHKWVGYRVGFEVLGTTWLQEGLADYLAFLAVGDMLGAEAMRHVIMERSIKPVAEFDGRIRALSAIEVLDSDREIAGPKGALVLRALHRRLGDDVFYAGLREFFSRYSFDHVNPNHFFAVMEEVSGQNLSTFQRDWVRGTRELNYALDRIEQVSTDEGYRLTLRVVSRGRLVEPDPADVVLTFEDGSRTTVSVAPDGKDVVLYPDARVVRIELDPDLWLPDWDRTSHVWTIEEGLI